MMILFLIFLLFHLAWAANVDKPATIVARQASKLQSGDARPGERRESMEGTIDCIVPDLRDFLDKHLSNGSLSSGEISVMSPSAFFQDAEDDDTVLLVDVEAGNWKSRQTPARSSRTSNVGRPTATTTRQTNGKEPLTGVQSRKKEKQTFCLLDYVVTEIDNFVVLHTESDGHPSKQRTAVMTPSELKKTTKGTDIFLVVEMTKSEWEADMRLGQKKSLLTGPVKATERIFDAEKRKKAAAKDPKVTKKMTKSMAAENMRTGHKTEDEKKASGASGKKAAATKGKTASSINGKKAVATKDKKKTTSPKNTKKGKKNKDTKNTKTGKKNKDTKNTKGAKRGKYSKKASKTKSRTSAGGTVARKTTSPRCKERKPSVPLKHKQRKVLVDYFKAGPFLSENRVLEISKKTGLEDGQIRSWFYRTRCNGLPKKDRKDFSDYGEPE